MYGFVKCPQCDRLLLDGQTCVCLSTNWVGLLGVIERNDGEDKLRVLEQASESLQAQLSEREEARVIESHAIDDYEQLRTKPD